MLGLILVLTLCSFFKSSLYNMYPSFLRCTKTINSENKKWIFGSSNSISYHLCPLLHAHEQHVVVRIMPQNVMFPLFCIEFLIFFMLLKLGTDTALHIPFLSITQYWLCTFPRALHSAAWIIPNSFDNSAETLLLYSHTVGDGGGIPLILPPKI